MYKKNQNGTTTDITKCGLDTKSVRENFEMNGIQSDNTYLYIGIGLGITFLLFLLVWRFMNKNN